MAQQEFIQQLTVYLRGGQTVVVPFHAASATQLNPQIEDFFKALADKNKQEGVFAFQGSRVVLVRVADVSSAEVVSLVRTPKEEKPEAKEAKKEAKKP